MNNFDVTIVGAGLAGLQCARLLASKGLKVLLVDRKSSLEEKIHTTGIFVRKTLEDFDLPKNCLGPAIRQVSLYSPAHRELVLTSQHEEFRIGRMGQLYLHYLTQCLLGGVSWYPDTSYVACSELSRQLIVNLNTRGKGHSIKTSYLIGGDGVASKVATDLRLDRNSEWIVGVEKVYEGISSDGPPRLLCFVDPRLAPGYIAWIAHDGHETHIGVGGYPKRFDPLLALETFQVSVRNIIDLGSHRPIATRGGRIPVGGMLTNIANEKGLLIGDAAGAVSPLTAGGLDPCMRLSALAAKVTVNYLETGDSNCLKDYSGEKFRMRFASRLWARRLAATVSQPMVAELGCALLRLPLLKNVAAHVFFGRGSFPDVEPQVVDSAVSLETMG